MIYIHGLIAALLLAFFASPVLAQQTCSEYRVTPSNAGGTVITSPGWKPSVSSAYVGSVRDQRDSCYYSTITVTDFFPSTGKCRITSASGFFPGCNTGTAFPTTTSTSVCSDVGFTLESRARTLGDPEEISVNVGYYLSDQSDASASSDKYFSMVGSNICRGGQRYTLGTSMGQWLQSDDCYTVAGKEYCLVSATFTATPICGACQQSDLDPDAKPSPRDTDGDGIPDNTDPDIDGDGLPNGSDPDADGDGNPDGGGGGSTDTDGDGIPDDTDPDDDNDGCPDGQTCPPDPDPKPDADGDGIPDDTDTDDDNNGCLDVNEPCTPGQDSDGDGIPDSTDTDDDNDGCLDVNEPCSGGGGDGDGDDGGDGQCDPATEDCNGTPGSFGGTCAAGFNCQGDAIQCAIAREIHMNNCKLYGDDDDPGSTFNQAKGGTDGFDPEELRNSAEQVNVGTFNQSGFGWSRACPSDPSIQLAFAGGAEFTIPFSRVCGPLGILSMAGVGITLLGCMVWVLGGRKS